MNLVPSDERGGRPAARRVGRPSRAAALGACALLAAVAAALAMEGRVLAKRAAAAEADRAALAASLDELERAARTLASDRETLRALHARERRLLRWDEERAAPAALLRGLARRVTDEVVFEELRRANGQVWITGRVSAGDALSAGTEELSRAGGIETLELLWVERAEESAAGQRFAVAGEIRYETAAPEDRPAGDRASNERRAGS